MSACYEVTVAGDRWVVSSGELVGWLIRQGLAAPYAREASIDDVVFWVVEANAGEVTITEVPA